MSEIQETFISHLVELRDRILRAVLAIVLVFLCLAPWAANVYDLIAQPMIATLPPGTKMIATGVITPFMVPIKVTLLAAVVIALPEVLYQAWAFVAPGLYARERKFALPLVLGSTLLFLAGIAFCYFFVFNTVFKFIGEFARVVEDPNNAPLLVHCASANRVGAMWTLYRVRQGIPLAIALEEGRTAGLRPDREAELRKRL